MAAAAAHNDGWSNFIWEKRKPHFSSQSWESKILCLTKEAGIVICKLVKPNLLSIFVPIHKIDVGRMDVMEEFVLRSLFRLQLITHENASFLFIIFVPGILDKICFLGTKNRLF